RLVPVISSEAPSQRFIEYGWTRSRRGLDGRRFDGLRAAPNPFGQLGSAEVYVAPHPARTPASEMWGPTASAIQSTGAELDEAQRLEGLPERAGPFARL